MGETTRVSDRAVTPPGLWPDAWAAAAAHAADRPCAGRLALTFVRSGRRTVVTKVYSEGVLKASSPLYLSDDGAATCYLIHLGGGGVAGDMYHTRLELQAGARAVLTPQAATKVFRSRHAPVVQATQVHLASESGLDLWAEPVIAFEGARYRQVTEVDMDPCATLLWTDVFTPGWAPDGRPYAYDEIRAKLMVRVAGEWVLFDHLRLGPPPEPAVAPPWPHGIGQLEGYSHYGSMLVIDPHMDEAFRDRLWEALAPYAADGRIGLSALRVPGFALRVLAPSTPAIESVFQTARALVYEAVFGRPPAPLRKL